MLLRVMSVSERKARSRAIPAFFGLDPAPPSFRYARPPNVLDVLQARFRLHRGYLTCFGKGFCRGEGTFFSTECGNERAAGYDGLMGKGIYLSCSIAAANLLKATF